MQSLVYIFIGLAGLGVGAAAYFGFTFSPIEALVLGAVFICGAVVIVERSLRRRAETRLEKAIGDLSRLLSTNAQAGAVLGQRVNNMADLEPGRRLDAAEADISVLGTVVKQVAEAVAELEEARNFDVRAMSAAAAAQSADTTPSAPASVLVEPSIPLEMLREAVEAGKLVFHIEPIVTLPQRRTHGYDLVPRLQLEEGELADPPDFMPRQGGEQIVRRIERQAIEEAITIIRRAATDGQPVTLYVPLSRATFVDAISIDKIVALLEANRAIVSKLIFAIAEVNWTAMPTHERAALAAFVQKGARLCLTSARSLRLDFAGLEGEGVCAVRVGAPDFIENPADYTDFHTSDITAYLKRFNIELIATGIENEQQILAMLEDGLTLAQGPHIAGPGPVRPDLKAARPERADNRHAAQV